MECESAKPISAISDMVTKFSKVCKFRSIGVFSSVSLNDPHPQNPIVQSGPLGEDSNNVTGSSKSNGEKIHYQPTKVADKDNVFRDKKLMEVFDMVSCLKLAYLEFQEAHIPYDPEKIIAADKRVVAELEKLCKFKRVYKEKQCKKDQFSAVHLDLLKAKIEARETYLGKLKSQNVVKESHILHLRQELKNLELGNKKMAEKIKQVSLEKRNIAGNLDITSFQDIYKEASKSIHDFAKPLISLLKASGWDLDKAAKSIEERVVYGKRSDKKYAFEAYIARRMFCGISLCAYDIGDIMKIDDPLDVLMKNPDSDFAKFCGNKYLLVVHPVMEASFFGNMDHRVLVLSGKHPRTHFYQLFAKMAKWVWALLGAAVTIDPNAVLFTVNSGSAYSGLCMESVGMENEGSLSSIDPATNKVGFMLMPGFRIRETLVKSRVYLSKTPTC